MEDVPCAPSSSDRVSFPAPAEVQWGRRWADYVSCAMGGSSGWDDSGDMHSGLQECDCASTIDRLIQHKDMCAGPFACDADACDMQWSAVWGRGEFASSRASLDQILGGLLRGTEVPRMPPQRLREMHELLRAHVGLSAATSERLDAQVAAAVQAQRARDFRQCYKTLDAVCDAYMPHHHRGGGGGGSGNTTACFACAAQHNSTVGVNCTKDELGELCVPHQHHHYQPPCNCSVESSARQPAFACDAAGSLLVAERVHWARGQATTRRCTPAWEPHRTHPALGSGSRRLHKGSAWTERASATMAALSECCLARLWLTARSSCSEAFGRARMARRSKGRALCLRRWARTLSDGQPVCYSHVQRPPAGAFRERAGVFGQLRRAEYCEALLRMLIPLGGCVRVADA